MEEKIRYKRKKQIERVLELYEEIGLFHSTTLKLLDSMLRVKKGLGDIYGIRDNDEFENL